MKKSAKSHKIDPFMRLREATHKRFLLLSQRNKGLRPEPLTQFGQKLRPAPLSRTEDPGTKAVGRTARWTPPGLRGRRKTVLEKVARPPWLSPRDPWATAAPCRIRPQGSGYSRSRGARWCPPCRLSRIGSSVWARGENARCEACPGRSERTP